VAREEDGPVPQHWSVALVGVAVLAGCASTPAAPGAAPAASSPADAARAAAQYAANTPPVSAQMPCGDEIRGEVADALGLGSVPAPQGTWSDHVYRCTYALPVGQLVLSVTVTPSDAAARTDLATMRTRLAAADPQPGVGQQAYGNAAGILVAAKDNMVLDVDASGLPDDLGATHERRADFAQVIASGVFTCWAGE
jgi:hypothetical protein